VRPQDLSISILSVIIASSVTSGGCSETESKTAARVEQVVTVEGGKIELSTPAGNQLVSMTFSEGTLPTSETIRLTQTSDYPQDPQIVPGATYQFEPSGIVFDKPVDVEIAYDPETLPSGANEEMIRLYKVVDGTWRIQQSTVDAAADVVRATIGGFSTWGLLAMSASSSDGGADTQPVTTTDAAVATDTSSSVDVAVRISPDAAKPDTCPPPTCGEATCGTVTSECSGQTLACGTCAPGQACSAGVCKQAGGGGCGSGSGGLGTFN